MSIFVTGTDTGVGKTRITVLLLRALRARGLRAAGMKPVCCGDRADAESLLAESTEGALIDLVNPVWLRTAASPYTASMVEQRTIATSEMLRAFAEVRGRFDQVLVEGAGGWLVPITESYWISDLAREMNLPILVVVRNRIGCLNHALLTVRSIEDCGLRCAAVVLNTFEGATDVATATNLEVLRTLIDVPVFATEAHGPTEIVSDLDGLVPIVIDDPEVPV